jgi:hypothetical protein
MVDGILRHILRLEGLGLFLAAVVFHHAMGMGWVLFVVLFFVPDLAFIAYAAGARIGAAAYNALHSTLGPLALSGWAFLNWPDAEGLLMAQVASIWFAHVGFDRMLGYGLKYSSGFKDTHLGKL